MGDALAVLELSSIARGLYCVDALVKRAEVSLHLADPVSPGKYVIVFSGGVEEVSESLDAGTESAAHAQIDRLFLPHAHQDLVRGLQGVKPPPVDGSVGILELRTVAGTILAADKALKCTEIRLLALHLARGIDGKGYFAFTGEQDEVEAALDAGDEAVGPDARAGREIIARPHPDFDWALGRL